MGTNIDFDEGIYSLGFVSQFRKDKLEVFLDFDTGELREEEHYHKHMRKHTVNGSDESSSSSQDLSDEDEEDVLIRLAPEAEKAELLKRKEYRLARMSNLRF